MRPFVIIEGEKYPVGMMIWDREGNVTKLTTSPEKSFGEFWDIEREDMDRVEIAWEDNNTLQPTSERG